MSSAFSIALSSLKAQSEAINTTGNNLANMNTTGFKESNVDFEDMLGQAMGTGTGASIGMGVQAPISSQVFTQGSLQSSTSPLATAIQGNGFFVVNSSSGQQLYTRDGDFQLSSTGALQTQTGETVQGWLANSDGTINTNGAPTNITLSTGTVMPPTATTTMSINANLDSTSTGSSNTASFPIQVVDSLGNQHTLTVNFTESTSSPGTWNYDVTIPGSDISGGTAGTNVSVLSSPGSITFNSSGTISSYTTATPNLSISNLADGASNMSINWNLLNSDGSGTITQYSEATALASSTQNGSQASQLTQVGIESGGQIVATFSNGKQTVEGQLALASIQNPQSLQNVGNNNYAATADTATPAVGMPDTGGRGQIVGGELESSNVDMATEFTNLIVYQSAYQASSRVITTADNMMQDLMNLIH